MPCIVITGGISSGRETTGESLTGVADLKRHLLILILPILLLLSACGITAVQTADPDSLSPEGHSYPFKVLHRLSGAARIPWFHDDEGCPIDREKATGVMGEALARWNLTGSVAFERVESASDAIVVIRWQSREIRGRARFGNMESILAQVVRFANADRMEIVLNSSLRWNPGPVKSAPKEKPAGQVDAPPRFPELPEPHLYSVILHEGGHVLGLGHVELEDSVMQPLQGHTVSEPSPGDLAGIRSLYGDDLPAAHGDIRIVCHDPDGGEYLAAPILRGIAPADSVGAYVVDLDGDEHDEILLLQSSQSWAPGTGLLLLAFDDRSLLKGTYGPLPAVIDGSSPFCYGRTTSGDGVIAHSLKDGRYHALIFKAGRLPARPWTNDTSWESIGGGGGDADGDGILDAPIVGISPLGSCDLDGDGHKETLKQGAP